jgi:hypothetical protein
MRLVSSSSTSIFLIEPRFLRIRSIAAAQRLERFLNGELVDCSRAKTSY